MMKRCQNCGLENEDEAKFCSSCGSDLLNTKPASQLDFNPNKDTTYQQPDYNQLNQSQSNYNQADQSQNYDNQQITYQQQTYRPANQKNVWIAIILDVIGGLILYCLCGIGQIYLGLTKRGLVLCGVGLLVVIINMLIIFAIDNLFGTLITLIIGVALVIYSVYDAYLCTNAINEGKPIPLLFGSLDYQ